MKLKYLVNELNQRLEGEDLPLLAVSKTRGVLPRIELMGDQGRAETIEHYKKCLPGDLIINRMAAHQGGLGIAPCKGAISPDYTVIRGPSELLSFLVYFMKSDLGLALITSLLKGIGSADSGTVRTPRLNWKDLAAIDLKFASLGELVESSNYLDKETSKIDLLISKKEQLIEKLLERRQALIAQVVTKGLDPDVPMKDSGIERLGFVPSNWRLGKLKAAFSRPVRSSGLIKGQASLESTTGTFPGYSASGQDVFISKELSIPEHEPGLVLSSVGARCGKTFLAMEENWGLVANTEGWIISEEYDPLYVWLVSQNSELWIRGGSAQPYVQTPLSIANKVPWPNKEVQEAISNYLSAQTGKIDYLANSIDQAIKLLKERRQALITAVVTGKLDVRGFSDGDS